MSRLEAHPILRLRPPRDSGEEEISVSPGSQQSPSVRGVLAMIQDKDRIVGLRRKEIAAFESWFRSEGKLMPPANLDTKVGELCPHLDTDARRVLITFAARLRNDPFLKASLAQDAEQGIDDHGNSYSVYFTQDFMGRGGQGMVHRVVLVDHDQARDAVLKSPLFSPLPSDTSGPEYKRAIAENESIDQVFALEVSNAETYWSDASGQRRKIPHVITPYRVLNIPARRLRGIVYEKVVTKSGLSRSFEAVASDPELALSNKLLSFSYAFDGLAALHAAGVAHMDFKLEQVLVDENNQGKVTDIATMVPEHVSLEPIIHTIDGENVLFLYRHCQVEDGSTVLVPLVHTPQYYDNDLNMMLLNEGVSLTLADRRAAGIALLTLLERAHFLLAGHRDDIAFACTNSPVSERLATTSNHFDCLFHITALAQELMNIRTQPMRSLSTIAEELRTYARQAKVELDPLFKQAFYSRPFSYRDDL